MATVDLSTIYKPHSGQSFLHFDVDAKVKILRVGRRWGKSRFALFELIKRFVESADIEVPDSVTPPFHAWIVAPSYPQARQVWNELITFLPPDFVSPGGFKQADQFIYLAARGGRKWGLIEVKSAHDPDTLQTAGLDFLWVTEAQDVSDAAFQKVLPTLRSPNRMAYAIYEGIPSLWPEHWFQRVFQAAERGREDHFAYQATAFDNPFLNDTQRAEIEEDKDILPEAVWKRMYLAEFSAEAGYFRNIDACIAGDLLSMPIPGTRYVAGMDLGRKVDKSELFIMDARDRRVVYHQTWDRDDPWPFQRDMVIKHYQTWQLDRLIIDATGMGGDIFTQELAEAGIPVEPFIFTANSRKNLLQELVVSMERQTVHYPNIPDLIRQLRAFQYKKLPSGDYRPEAPSGEHDDAVFGLALGLMACDNAQPVTGVGLPGYRGRYVPTQQEANEGINFRSHGARVLRGRMVSKMAERQERLGVS
jgi:hypothetical protein